MGLLYGHWPIPWFRKNLTIIKCIKNTLQFTMCLQKFQQFCRTFPYIKKGLFLKNNEKADFHIKETILKGSGAVDF